MPPTSAAGRTETGGFSATVPKRLPALAMRSPIGLVLSRAFPALYRDMNIERLAPFFQAFRDGLIGAATHADPRICLLTPGPYNETYFEQAYLARYLGFLLVEGGDLTMRDGQIHVRTIAGLKRADVIWRRIDSDYADPLELNAKSRLGVPGLVEALRAGGVVIANALGSGVLEAPVLMSFLPRPCERVLGEDLLMPNVATWWCGQPREREKVLPTPENMAIAGAFGNPVLDYPPNQARRRRMAFGGRKTTARDRNWRARHRFRRPGSGQACRRRRYGKTARSRRGLLCCGSMRRARAMAGRSCPAASAASPDGRMRGRSRWAKACAPPMFGCSPIGRSNLSRFLPTDENVRIRRVIGQFAEPSRRQSFLARPLSRTRRGNAAPDPLSRWAAHRHRCASQCALGHRTHWPALHRLGCGAGESFGAGDEARGHGPPQQRGIRLRA